MDITAISQKLIDDLIEESEKSKLRAEGVAMLHNLLKQKLEEEKKQEAANVPAPE